MDYKNTILIPKSISKLIITYFTLFIKNSKLLIGYNLIVLLGFYFFSMTIENIDFSKNYFNKSFYYVLYFTIPVSFITPFYLTLIENKKPTLNNILQVFNEHYIKILGANIVLASLIFIINFTISSELMMYQYHNFITFISVEILNTILFLGTIIIVYRINPYHSKYHNYFTTKLVKYLFVTFILLLFSNFLYRISFNIVIVLIETLSEIITNYNPDYLYNLGTIFIEYCNVISFFTVLIYIYFNFTADIKNKFHLDEINQIKLHTDNEDDEIDTI